MCNACGNVCCGSDEFGGCGCDGCEEPECWAPDDNDLTDRDDDYDPWDGYQCCAKPTAIVCESVEAPQ